jgi:hypothetical protein
VPRRQESDRQKVTVQLGRGRVAGPKRFSLPLRLATWVARLGERDAPAAPLPEVAAPENLALRRPALQSSVSERWSRRQRPEDEAAGGNDGVIDGSQGFTTESEAYPWWQVDLEAVCRLRELRLYNRRDWAHRLTRFGILVSLDGRRWVEAFRKADDIVFGDKDLLPFVAALPRECAARFVRIQLYGRDYLHFNECQVFGDRLEGAALGEAERWMRVRLQEEEARSRQPVAEGLSEHDIDIELALSQALFAFPEAQLRRLRARQWILDGAGVKGGVGAQIGVFRGHFSELLLGSLAPRKLFLVDPWTRAGEFYAEDGASDPQARLPTLTARREAQLRAARFPASEAVIVEDVFPSCASSIDEPLDWIYFDSLAGDGDVPGLLKAAAALLKPGGLILGDGFTDDPALSRRGAAHAVNSFAGAEGFDFVAAGPGGQWCLRANSKCTRLERRFLAEGLTPPGFGERFIEAKLRLPIPPAARPAAGGVFDFLAQDGRSGAAEVARLNARHRFLVEPFREEIRGSTVLDLGAHDGRWSYALAQAGASWVYGIEARGQLLARFQGYPGAAPKARVDLVQADVFEMLPCLAACELTFDVVALYGIFSHVMDHYHLLKLVRRLQPRLVIIDAEFVMQESSHVCVRTEDAGLDTSGIAEVRGRRALVGTPSLGALEAMARALSYDLEWLDWRELPVKERGPVEDYFGDGERRRGTCVLRPIVRPA